MVNVMIDPLSVASTWAATKEILNIGKGILALKVSLEVQGKVQAMMDKTSLLYERIALLEQEMDIKRDLISELKEKINKTKNFKREFKKYKPHQFITGSLVYAYDTSVNSDKPMHYICANCVSESIISILQPNDNEKKIICHKCNSEYIVKFKKMNINPSVINYL